MPPIYVNTDNTNATDKMYNGTLAKDNAAAAEKKMQEVVIKTIAKDPGFTTANVPNPKGYSIKLKIAKLESTGRETKCTVSGELLRYPNMKSIKGSGVGMVSTSFTGSAAATGMGKFAVIDCVEVITESMIKKAIPAMKLDINKW
jgi:hypothetical protein